MWPLAVFPPSFLERSRETELPQDRLTYDAPPHKNGAPISVSADLPSGRRARCWGEAKEFPFAGL